MDFLFQSLINILIFLKKFYNYFNNSLLSRKIIKKKNNKLLNDFSKYGKINIFKTNNLTIHSYLKLGCIDNGIFKILNLYDNNNYENITFLSKKFLNSETDQEIFYKKLTLIDNIKENLNNYFNGLDQNEKTIKKIFTLESEKTNIEDVSRYGLFLSLFIDIKNKKFNLNNINTKHNFYKIDFIRFNKNEYIKYIIDKSDKIILFFYCKYIEKFDKLILKIWQKSINKNNIPELKINDSLLYIDYIKNLINYILLDWNKQIKNFNIISTYNINSNITMYANDNLNLFSINNKFLNLSFKNSDYRNIDHFKNYYTDSFFNQINL